VCLFYIYRKFFGVNSFIALVTYAFPVLYFFLFMFTLCGRGGGVVGVGGNRSVLYSLSQHMCRHVGGGTSRGGMRVKGVGAAERISFMFYSDYG